jgi:hypothetical protein
MPEKLRRRGFRGAVNKNNIGRKYFVVFRAAKKNIFIVALRPPI